MKHRSIGVLIILSAIFAAAPQATRELRSLKNSLGERARAEILQAFLSLHTRDGAKVSAPQVRQIALASCDTTNATEPQSAPRAARSEGRAGSNAVAAAPRQQAEQWAMIIEPLPGIPTDKSEVASAMRAEEMVEAVAENSFEFIAGQELAMIIPPDQAIPPPTVAAARRRSSERTAARLNRSAERERRAEDLRAAHFDFEELAKLSAAGLGREAAEAVRAANELRANGKNPRLKVFKFKREPRQGYAPSSWVVAPRPEKHAAAPLPSAHVGAIAPVAPFGE